MWDDPSLREERPRYLVLGYASEPAGEVDAPARSVGVEVHRWQPGGRPASE